jgi:hypothetical protein
MSNRDLLLGRHRTHKAKRSDEIFSKQNKPEPAKPVVGNMVSRFLNRLTAGAI